MWHGRDSRSCVFSVKEMFLKGKAHCVRTRKSSTLSTTPRRQLIERSWWCVNVQFESHTYRPIRTLTVPSHVVLPLNTANLQLLMKRVFVGDVHFPCNNVAFSLLMLIDFLCIFFLLKTLQHSIILIWHYNTSTICQ